MDRNFEKPSDVIPMEAEFCFPDCIGWESTADDNGTSLYGFTKKETARIARLYGEAITLFFEAKDGNEYLEAKKNLQKWDDNLNDHEKDW